MEDSLGWLLLICLILSVLKLITEILAGTFRVITAAVIGSYAVEAERVKWESTIKALEMMKDRRSFRIQGGQNCSIEAPPR